MKAIVCREISDNIATLKLEEVELPALQPSEARVRIRAAAVNFTDILTVQGKYQHKPAVPFTPGSEAAGDVIAVGPAVTEVKLGDRVICGGLGCYAEEMHLAAAGLRKIPDGIGYGEAASFTVGYLTAYVALVRRARLQSGEWLLVHGAAGGVGLAAVDLLLVQFAGADRIASGQLGRGGVVGDRLDLEDVQPAEVRDLIERERGVVDQPGSGRVRHERLGQLVLQK